jgi:hypothetical protein
MRPSSARGSKKCAVCFRWGRLVAALILPSVMVAQTKLLPPQPAPELYVTDNYGLMLKVPRGLSYCRLPEGWSGSDHGTVLFLKAPSGCIPSQAYASSSRPTPEFVPVIYLYYGHNVAEIERGNGESSPPQTSAEYAQLFCKKPFLPVPQGLKLLGKPALGCRHDHGDRVEIHLAGLFTGTESGLDITLSTTRQRLAQDLRMLSSVAAEITECQPSWDKRKMVRPACPKAPWW